MQVNMYNMQFGDCFLICDEHENILVDFGSDNLKCDMASVANHIELASEGKRLSCLISHFHEDHISGFLKGLLKAENIYVPDIVAMSNTVGKLSFLQLEILADIFKWISVGRTGPLKITLYDLLLKICDQKGHVHFLQRGSQFWVSAKEYQVLWPDFSTLAIHGRVENRILHMLAKLGLISQEVLKENKQPSKRESSEQLYIYEVYPREPLPIEIVDPFISGLVNGYEALDGDRANQSFDKQQLQVAYDKMTADLSATLNASINDENALQQDLADLGASMRRQANKYSVVFHDAPQDGVSSILMTGDITIPEFNRLLTNQVRGMPEISAQYTIVKAPHHATSTHFSPRLPQCAIIMASNGEPNTNHTSWKKIDYQYGSFYQSHKKVEIVCTNRRCELLELPKTPCCHNCGNSSCSYNGDSVVVIP